MRRSIGISRKPFLAAVVLLCVAMSFLFQPTMPAGGRDAANENEASGGDDPKGLPGFLPVDTSRLMGSPDPIPPMKVAVAFPRLKIARPVQPTHAGDGSRRMFVATQRGLVNVFPNRSDVGNTDVFLDLRKVVSPGNGDNGMLGIAFHPKYKRNGEFFVVYTTRARPSSTIVSRFRVSKNDPNRADRKSEEVLLKIRQPLPDHNASCLQFGPDGYLYIALGDGGYHPKNGHAQDLSTLLGKMLRINVDRKENGRPYAIPKDNPFVARKNSRGEIWAYGLRAPWRFSFDRITGDCWLGDNGQNMLEEINLIVRGGNYGWIERAGSKPFDPATVVLNRRQQQVRNRAKLPKRRPLDPRNPRLFNPVFEYAHDKGKSVVGGIVYRGKRLPQLIGTYLYADYAVGKIWGLRWDGKRVTENTLIAETRRNITSCGEDENGEVYFTAFDGRIYHLQPAVPSGNAPRFPNKLSETGLFESVADLRPVGLRPVKGMIPYSVNVPLWSDHAGKGRFLALPGNGKVVYREEGAWGTVFVKHFGLDLSPRTHRRLETRLFVLSPRGWAGYTYRWNDEQTDALLLGEPRRKRMKCKPIQARGSKRGRIPVARTAWSAINAGLVLCWGPRRGS